MKPNYWTGIVILMALTMFLLYGANKPSIEVKAEDPKNVIIVEKPVFTEPDNPRDYITYVFGEDAPKAFLLLKGNDVCGGENRSLNPDAVNVNSDSRQTRDVGIFQINEFWHRINAKWLFNWKINIEIAHQLFVENGNTFKLWSAGKCMGI